MPTLLVGSEITIDSDKVYYAIWTEASYKLIFDYQGATSGNTVIDKAVIQGVEVGTLPTPIRNGYSFGGWYTEANGKGSQYTRKTIYDVPGDTILYAKWASRSNPGGGGTVKPQPTAKPDPISTSDPVSSPGPNQAILIVEGLNSQKNVIYTNTTNESIGETITIEAPVISGYILNDELKKSIVIEEGSNKLIFNYKESGGGLVLNKGEHIAYIKGYPDETVRPENAITRAEAAVIFYRLVVNSDKNDAVNSIFADVTNEMWYSHEVDYLAKYEIIQGYEDGTFRPDESITRAEFAVMASRFDQLDNDHTNSFTDITDEYWAVEYINSAAAKGWINGFEDGTFRPEEKITREQVVTLVNRMLERRIDLEDIPENIKQFNDLEKSHWSYADIMEATIEHDYKRKQSGSEIWTSYTFFNNL